MLLSKMRQIDPMPSVAWVHASNGIARTYAGLKRAKIDVSGAENLPNEPVIFAGNHTHWYDPVTMRVTLFRYGFNMRGWAKARAYKDPLFAFLMNKTGNIPLASRGYIIAGDYAALMGEKPSDEAYRQLRQHVDYGVELPDSAENQKILNTPRTVFEWDFDPSRQSYRGFVRELFFEMMQITLEHARRCIEAGYHMQIYPQGSVSSRLSEGRVGVINAALALNLPIVPIGQSGCRHVFVDAGPRLQKGTIRMRIGEPMRVDRARYPKDFRAFNPDDEDTCRHLLEEDTRALMERINLLLEPEFQWAEDRQSDGREGVARFY